MKSRFTLKSYMLILLIIILSSVVLILSYAFFFLDQKVHFGMLLFLPFPIFATVWLFFGELRNKMIKFRFDNDFIIINKFAGFYKDEVYKLAETQGFIISDLPSNNGNYEYLYIIKDKKKIVKLSEYYHANYDELKEEIQNMLNYLGREEFSYIDDFNEMFS